MKLKEIHRTSTFAWAPLNERPLLATGTVAGALDESFSNESKLEIWAPNFVDRSEYQLGGEGNAGPTGVVSGSSRYALKCALRAGQISKRGCSADSTASLGGVQTLPVQRVFSLLVRRTENWASGILRRSLLVQSTSHPLAVACTVS